MEFELENKDFIELNNLLKVTGLCDSGGRAKVVISEGAVTVNGKVELRKRCKIRRGDKVMFMGEEITVV